MLKAMNRGYSVEEYRQFIDRVRNHLPDAMIAGDFIVGFSGETEEDFQQSIELLRYCRYKNSFIFKYSPRPGTPAYDRLPDDVPDEVKRRRNNELLAVQAEIGRQVHAEQVGRVFEVFVEGLSTRARKQQGRVEVGWKPQITQLSGRTMGDLIVMFDGDPSLIGRIVRVRIEDAQPLTLFGRLVDQPAAELRATAPR
jgi:tRNA-2-methylthio-N6-dimethylallyladenosine synthase